MADSDSITRTEYETRHSELRTEMLSLRAEDATLRKEMTTSITILDGKIDSLSKKLDDARVSSWKLISFSLINFLLGGGIVAVLNYLHFPK